ncbi:threonine/serine dehydratase [Buttiauxella agrestis]|uniref:Threonine dehydratase n=1 Tax=Buttiauxella agrestis ATCC 33320 TaxID=1006004 RepID=A0A085GBX2_9ENTR|nr:threonine/serine dehydratase [Buttiauxella agrestis]KFC81217.1 threonine dehydratase [Buttiauxella agrestis ATCC 33320]
MSQLLKLFTASQEAHTALRPQVRKTPLDRSHMLSTLYGCDLFLKGEHLQHTGSFKFRGASNKIRLLTPEQKAQGVITASSGNHGQGMALAGAMAGIPVTVFVPATASPLKIDAIRAYGATVNMIEKDALSVELEAAETAAREGITFVSPYNDEDVIAGQGTIAFEMFETEPKLDAVFVAVGGGGLISGIGAVMKHLSPETRIVACWPEASVAMYASLQAGEIVEPEEHDTLSDGTAGGLEPGTITFPLCQAVVDDCVLVSEEEIKAAMKTLARYERWMVEGAAGVAMAAFMQQAEQWRGKRVAVVLCGKNIILEKFTGAVK